MRLRESYQELGVQLDALETRVGLLEQWFEVLIQRVAAGDAFRETSRDRGISSGQSDQDP
jgi:hypothetical protein